jgi:hypothetical protein
MNLGLMMMGTGQCGWSEHAQDQVTGWAEQNRDRPPKRWEGQEVYGSDRRAEVSETSGGGGWNQVHAGAGTSVLRNTNSNSAIAPQRARAQSGGRAPFEDFESV